MRDLCVGSASARTALCTHTCMPSAEQSALSPHMHRIALPDATGTARTGTWETGRGGGAEGGAVALALRREGSVSARSIQASEILHCRSVRKSLMLQALTRLSSSGALPEEARENQP